MRHKTLRSAAASIGATIAIAIAIATPQVAGAAVVTVTPALPAPGDAVSVRAAGFVPGTRGEAALGGAPKRRVRADRAGRVTVVLLLRASTGTGPHRLRVRAGRREMVTSVTILRPRAAPSTMAVLEGQRRVLVPVARGRPGDTIELRLTRFPRGAPVSARLGGIALAPARAGSGTTVVQRATVPALPSSTRALRVTVGRFAVSLRFQVLPAVTAPPPLPQPPPGVDPVIAAAGDIACSPNDPAFNGGAGTAALCRQAATSDLLAGTGLSAVLALGDVQYDCATPADFAGSFLPSWGRVLSIVRPTPGNHEYIAGNPDLYGARGCTSGAAGYFSTFGSAAGDPGRGYYSFDLGSWHIVSLNTNLAGPSSCPIVSCAASSDQVQWLEADLAASRAACTLVYWHHPLFSSKAPSDASRPFWDALYEAGADVVLNGHVHNYERFAPQRPDGTDDPVTGIRQFVVGTGGKSLEKSGRLGPRTEASGSAFGVLRMALRPGSYDWRFVPIAGASFTDAGSAACHR